MSEVWEFKNGVMWKVANPGNRRPQEVLVYLPATEIITSHQMLENRLREKGWVHYPRMPLELIQYHKGPHSDDLLSLPRDF
ncbi:hypothetical protein ZIOFF_031533 [Zingiber officinale]|uniref:Uncharacterized protein n=1 Tax=Zingiber officinale TaxID=94328 RepID=A0A8J5GLJ7_ZINOF|nr:hypothetical protein ZIOFF_031533 [Zingiber officinale]